MRPAGDTDPPAGGAGRGRSSSAATAGRWPPAATTGLSACGTPIPARRLAQPMKGTGAVTGHRVQQRTAAFSQLDVRARPCSYGTPAHTNPSATDGSGLHRARCGVQPGGHTVAAGADDGTIQLWNVGDQTQLGDPLTGHKSSVGSLDFSPDGTRLLSASDNDTIRILASAAALYGHVVRQTPPQHELPNSGRRWSP